MIRSESKGRDGAAEPRSIPDVANLLRALNPAPTLAYVNCCHGDSAGLLGIGNQLGDELAGRLDMGHAQALLPLAGGQQVALAQRIVQKGLSVREAERLVQHLLNPPRKAPEREADRDLLRLQEELSDGLGTNVAIRSNKKGAGKVTIDFASLDQLEGLLARLRG